MRKREGLKSAKKCHILFEWPLQTTLLKLSILLIGLVNRKRNQFTNVNWTQRRCHMRLSGIATNHLWIVGSDDQDLGSEIRKLYLNSWLDVFGRTYRYEFHKLFISIFFIPKCFSKAFLYLQKSFVICPKDIGTIAAGNIG